MSGSLLECVRSFALGAALLVSAVAAHAGAPRLVTPPPEVVNEQPGPVTPEPVAGLAFGLGLGVVVWAVRRRTPR